MSEYLYTDSLSAEQDALCEQAGDLTGEDYELAQERITAIEELKQAIPDGFEEGQTLIPEDDFEEYARELAEDTGAISDGYQWPQSCIDWGWAARELAMDYTLVTFEGTDYYVRSD